MYINSTDISHLSPFSHQSNNISIFTSDLDKLKQTHANSNKAMSTKCSENSNSILLQTDLAAILSSDNNTSQKVRILFDSGYQWLQNKMRKKLNLKHCITRNYASRLLVLMSRKQNKKMFVIYQFTVKLKNKMHCIAYFWDLFPFIILKAK